MSEESENVGSTEDGTQVVMMTSEPVQNDTADEGDTDRSLKLNLDDALHFLEQVKSQFTEDPAVYNEFLDIMKKFNAQPDDTAGGVVRRISRLFHGHKDLILGFSLFLPTGCKIELRDDDPNSLPEESDKTFEFDQAVNFISKVKSRFKDNEAMYRRFVDTLLSYEEEERTIRHFYRRVSELFCDHPDLVNEFFIFLQVSKGAAAKSAQAQNQS